MATYLVMTTLGDYIEKLRVAKGFSYRELAEKAGISFATIQDIESGKTKNPGIQAIIGLSKALNTPVVKLIHAYEGRDPDAFPDMPTDENQTDEMLEAIEKVQEILRRRKSQ